MASFSENVAQIRDAAKGIVVREAIASAIEQVDENASDRASEIQSIIENVQSSIQMQASLSLIADTDYTLVLTAQS